MLEMLDRISGMRPKQQCPRSMPTFAPVVIQFAVNTDAVRLQLHTDESYTLTIDEQHCPCLSPTPCWNPVTTKCSPPLGQISPSYDQCDNYNVWCSSQTRLVGVLVVVIKAATFFGARHALETMSQMIAYDKVSLSMHTVACVRGAQGVAIAVGWGARLRCIRQKSGSRTLGNACGAIMISKITRKNSSCTRGRKASLARSGIPACGAMEVSVQLPRENSQRPTQMNTMLVKGTRKAEKRQEG